MHASATSIDLTALCNVHRFFFPVLLKLGKIKIVKYSSAIFWPIFYDCKVHFSFWQHCSSCSINFPSIGTHKPQKWIQIIGIHPYNLVTATRKKSCSVRKCMVHLTNRRWSVQPLHLVVLTRVPRWYYNPSKPDDRRNDQKTAAGRFVQTFHRWNDQKTTTRFSANFRSVVFLGILGRSFFGCFDRKTTTRFSADFSSAFRP